MINKILGRPAIKLEDDGEDAIGTCDFCNSTGPLEHYCGQCSQHSIHA